MKSKTAVLFLLSSFPVAAQGWVDRTTWNAPPARYQHAMCYDPVHGYVLMVGGLAANGYLTTDVWSWDGATWTPRGVIPGGHHWAMAFDPVMNEVVLAMERGSANTNLETYSWDGTQWSALGAAQSIGSPSAADSVLLAFDPLRGQMCLYGAQGQAGWPNILLRTGSSWVSSPVPTRPIINPYYTGMAWDPSAGRIALTTTDFGGTLRYYEWTGFNWQHRTPTVHPGFSGAAVTDSLHGRVLMVEGDYMSVIANHTWVMADGAFQQLSTPIEPVYRERTSMAFDQGRGVCVLFGGFNGYAMGDTWEFDLGPVASYSTFGSGCLGSRGVPHISAQGTSMPRVGSTFTLQANNLPWTGATFLFLGLSNTAYSGTPLPFNLATMGAPNCSVLCSGDQLQVMSTVLGSGAWSWQVPPLPGLTFYNQAFALDPTTNSLGLVTSNAGTGIIGL